MSPITKSTMEELSKPLTGELLYRYKNIGKTVPNPQWNPRRQHPQQDSSGQEHCHTRH